jgi:hypothetical protein
MTAWMQGTIRGAVREGKAMLSFRVQRLATLLLCLLQVDWLGVHAAPRRHAGIKMLCSVCTLQCN